MRSHQEAYRHQALCRLLSFEEASSDNAVDLRTPQGEAFWREAVSAALTAGLLSAVCHRRLPQYIEIQTGGQCATESNTERQVRAFVAEHRYRCDNQKAHLLEAIRALNACEITPALMSGSRAIWSSDPAWCFVNRLGFLVPREAFSRAAEALTDTGYRNVRSIDESGFQRELHFFRSDVNGVVVLRDMNSHHLLAQLLDHREMKSCECAEKQNEVEVQLPPPHLALLCDLLHRSSRRPMFASLAITLKELYEFASAFVRLEVDDLAALNAFSLQHPGVGALLAAWAEEARNAFGIKHTWRNKTGDLILEAWRPIIQTVRVAPEPGLFAHPFLMPMRHWASRVYVTIRNGANRLAFRLFPARKPARHQ